MPRSSCNVPILSRTTYSLNSLSKGCLSIPSSLNGGILLLLSSIESMVKDCGIRSRSPAGVVLNRRTFYPSSSIPSLSSELLKTMPWRLKLDDAEFWCCWEEDSGRRYSEKFNDLEYCLSWWFWLWIPLTFSGAASISIVADYLRI